MSWYKAEVTDSRNPDQVQRVEGTGDVVGAWLRALADNIDPPRRGGSMPAETVRTVLRSNDDLSRQRGYGRRIGFYPTPIAITEVEE